MNTFSKLSTKASKYLLRKRQQVINKQFLLRQLSSFAQAFVGLIIIYGIIYGISYVASQLAVSLFAPLTERGLALEIYRALVEADGVLIGFTGIITAYVFGDIRSRIESPANQTVERRSKLLDRRSNAAWITGLTMLSFILSILVALGSISKLKDAASPGDFYGTLTWMLEGMAGVFWLISYSSRD